MYETEKYEDLKVEIKGMEAMFERFFEKVFETTTAKFERDFHFTEI